MSMNPTDRSFLKMALGHPAFVLGFVLSAMFIVLALVSFIWTPFDPTRLDIAGKLRGPSLEHWFGTDHFGRDMFSMIMVGARVSIAVAFVAVGIGMIIGVPLGLYAAAAQGQPARRDHHARQRPDLRLPVAVARDHDHRASSGPARSTPSSPSASSTCRSSPGVARGAALPLWTRDYILAARTAGKGQGADLRRTHPAQHRQPPDRAGYDPVLARHPGRGSTCLCRARRTAAVAKLGPHAGRGADDDFARPMLMAVFPGFAIIITVLGLNLMGDGLRDLSTPD
jgi:peptide/nickel transport system permease protein